MNKNKRNHDKNDSEKIFVCEFKKMMMSGIIVRKINKRFGFKYHLIRLLEGCKEFEICKINDDLKKIIVLSEIKNLELYDKNKLKITLPDKIYNFEFYDENLANIFKDGTNLLIKEINSLKNILKFILENIESDSESETSVTSLHVNIDDK